MRFTSMQVAANVVAVLIGVAVFFVLSAQNRNLSGGLTNTQQATLEPTDSIFLVPVSTADVINATASARDTLALTISPPLTQFTRTPIPSGTANP